MAIHTTLEIHGTARDLLRRVVKAAAQMPRDVKPVLAKDLVGRCLDLTTLIRRANVAVDKAPHLETLLERKDEIEELLRAAVDGAFIARGHYGEAIQLTQSLGRQASGWKKFSSSTPVAQSSRRPGPSESQSGRAARPQGDRHAR